MSEYGSGEVIEYYNGYVGEFISLLFKYMVGCYG